jgi:hypothetical protein
MERAHLASDEMSDLRKMLQGLPEIISFRDRPQFAASVTCIGIEREIGTHNDELARFIFSAEMQLAVPTDSLYSERIWHRGKMGLCIRSRVTSRMELRAKHIRYLLHPDLSFNTDGTLHSLVVIPELIAQITDLQGVELVIVKRWAMNTIFGGFDPRKEYYQANFWELENNDTLLFSELTKNRQIAFLGTHDLMAHIAGVSSAAVDVLTIQARGVNEALQSYFQSSVDHHTPIAAMIIPYTIGVVLDDLAQPPTYGSRSHEIVAEELLNILPGTKFLLHFQGILTKYPSTFEKVILISRSSLTEVDRPRVRRLVQELYLEIKSSLGCVSI